MTLRRIPPPTESTEQDPNYEPFTTSDGSTAVTYRGVETGNLYEMLSSPNGSIRWFVLDDEPAGEE